MEVTDVVEELDGPRRRIVRVGLTVNGDTHPSLGEAFTIQRIWGTDLTSANLRSGPRPERCSDSGGVEPSGWDKLCGAAHCRAHMQVHGAEARGEVSGAVRALVSNVIRNVLMDFHMPMPAVAAQATAPESSPALVEAWTDDQSWRPACVIDRRDYGPAPGVYIEYDHALPPTGQWEYYTKEDERLADTVDALYEEPEVAQSVREVIVAFQPAESTQLVGARLTDRLRANICVALPEYYRVLRDNERLSNICTRFGRNVDSCVALNKLRSPKTLMKAKLLDPASRLRRDTIILLPRAMRDARKPQPHGPSAGSSHEHGGGQAAAPTAEPTMPTAEPLKMGCRVWVDARLPDDDGPRWRPATVTNVGGDGSFEAGCIAGDREWRERALRPESEGTEWVRAKVCDSATSSYQKRLKGPAGSGQLVRPYAERRQVQRFTDDKARRLLRARPALPSDGEWLVALVASRELCEVLFDGSWQVARLDAKEGEDTFVAELPLAETSVTCGAGQLRPITADPQVYGVEKEAEPAAAAEGTPAGAAQAEAAQAEAAVAAAEAEAAAAAEAALEEAAMEAYAEGFLAEVDDEAMEGDVEGDVVSGDGEMSEADDEVDRPTAYEDNELVWGSVERWPPWPAQVQGYDSANDTYHLLFYPTDDPKPLRQWVVGTKIAKWVEKKVRAQRLAHTRSLHCRALRIGVHYPSPL